MSFSYDKYLKPISSTDRYIQILDDSGVIKYTINPFSVLNSMILNNLLRINLRGGKIITLVFSSINESKIALTSFQEQVNQLVSKVPLNVDKSVENYVQDKVSQVDFDYGNGLKVIGQTVSVGGNLSDSIHFNGQYNDLIAVGFDYISFTSSVFDVVSDFVSLDSIDNIQILAQTDLVIDSGNVLSLSGSSSLVSISDGRGLVYQSDYSPTFVTNSVINKKYVDDKITSISEINSPTFSINSATTIVDGHILPSLDLTYDLGSTSSQWRSLHVGSGSIYIGGVTLSSAGDSLVVNSISVGGADSNLVISAGDNNLNVSGDLVVAGNMTINGTTSTINTENLIVKDALILLASDQIGTPTLDSGILINRGIGLTQGFIWDESEGHFALVSTLQSSLLESEVSISSHSDLKLNKLNADSIQLTNGAQSDYILISDSSGNASWTASIPGTSGTSGTSGIDGTSGSSGSSGTSGSSGSSGTSGSSGSSGTSGSSGSSGTSGSAGSSGSSGSNGSSGSSGLVSFTLPDTPNPGQTWILLGTWNTSQAGHTLRMTLSAHAGYNAGVDQNQTTVLYFATSNGISTNPSAVGGSYYANGSAERNINLGTQSLAPSVFRIVQSNTSTYLVYGNFGQWAGNSHYTISTSGATTWIHSGVTSSTPSGTYLDITPASSGSSGSGSNGTSGTSGTSGLTPTSDWTLTGGLTVGGTSSFNGLTVLQEVSEVINTTPGATAATVVYDFSTGSNWYHSSANTNFTANFINVPITNNRAITTTIVINQGATAYIPTALQINSATQTIKWSGGTASGTANQVDIVGFTFIRDGAGNWVQVLGQINTFD